MGEKKVYRRLPCSLYEPGVLGHWLDDCSGEGLRLERLRGGWAVFSRDVPQRSRHRFYPGRSDDNQKELFLEMGWEFVTMMQSEFAVFRCVDPTAPELCTDPVVEAEAYRRCDRKFLQSLIWMIAEPFLSILLYLGLNWMLYGGMMNGALWRGRMSLVHLFAGGFEIALALLLFFVTTWLGAVCRFRSIHTLRRSLARGEPVDYSAPVPRRCFFSVRAWEGLAAVVLFLSLIWLNCIDRQTFPEVSAPVPAPLLSALEGEGFTYGDRAGQESYAERKSTLLSETFCEARQSGDEMLLWLDSTYVRVRFPQLAEPVFAALAEAGRNGIYTAIFGEAVERPVADSRFDRLRCFECQRVYEDGKTGHHVRTVAALRGRQVVCLRYSGGQPLPRLLDELDDMMKRFEEDGR